MAFEQSYGASFSIGSAALSGTPTYTAVAQVRSIGEYSVSQIMADVTNHASTGGYREKFPTGIFEVDDVEVELIYDPATATHDNASGGLMHALLNKTLLAYKIQFNDTSSTNWTFDAYVSNTTDVVDNGEDALVQNVTLTVTGQPVLA